MEHIRLKAGPLTQKAASNAAAASGTTMIQTLPGNVLHSNDINPEAMLKEMLQAPMLSGLIPEQAQAFANWSLTYMQQKSRKVEAPAPTVTGQTKLAQNGQVAQASQIPLSGSTQATATAPAVETRQTATEDVDLLSDWSETDPDDEVEAANADRKEVKRRKTRISKAEKKERLDATGSKVRSKSTK